MHLLLASLLWLVRPAAAADATPEQIDRWMDSVVLLLNGPGWCSGVVIDDEGTVATAYHCVASGTRPRVSPRPKVSGDGVLQWRHYEGRAISAAPRDDLALVSVPDLAGKVPPLVVRGERPLVGERVYGIGHPFAPAADRTEAMEGMLLWTVTEGIVSAVGPRLVQTDAALNPGNSGGPVVDSQGRIIGITSRKLGGDNIAFLASSERLEKLVAEPRDMRVLGGQWSLGVSLIGVQAADGSDALELRGGPIVRDRLVIEGGVGVPLGARARAQAVGSARTVAAELSGGLRQRFGRGTWSTAVDVGGGVWGLGQLVGVSDPSAGTFTVYTGPSLMVPGVYGRVGVLGGALRVVLVPGDDPLWLFAVDLDAPGVVATF